MTNYKNILFLIGATAAYAWLVTDTGKFGIKKGKLLTTAETEFDDVPRWIGATARVLGTGRE